MATDTMPRTPGAPGPGPGRRTPPDRVMPPRPGASATAATAAPLRTTVPPAIPGVPGRSKPRRPVSAPRHTRPVTGPAARPATGPAPQPATSGRLRARSPRARSPRAPFILLLVGLLGGALVSLLVISTTLAQGAFQITNLQQRSADLARQEQILSNQVAQAGNPAVIASEAAQLGMRQDPNLRFYDAKTGKIVAGKVSKSDAAINVPGYTP